MPTSAAPCCTSKQQSKQSASDLLTTQATFDWPSVSPDLKLPMQFVRRTAWIFQAPNGLYLAKISDQPEWTADPAQAMSWLDPVLAASRLRLALPSAGVLVSMSFKASTCSFPFHWTTDNERY